MSGIECLLDSERGIYIPRDFADYFLMEQWNVKAEDAAILLDPDHELYWETWEYVLDTAQYVDVQSNVWTLYQDGDLFAVCDELLTDEERENFGFFQ